MISSCPGPAIDYISPLVTVNLMKKILILNYPDAKLLLIFHTGYTRKRVNFRPFHTFR